MAKHAKVNLVAPNMEVSGVRTSDNIFVKTHEEQKTVAEVNYNPVSPTKDDPVVVFRGAGSRVVTIGKRNVHLRFGKENNFSYSTNDKEIIAALDERGFQRA